MIARATYGLMLSTAAALFGAAGASAQTPAPPPQPPKGAPAPSVTGSMQVLPPNLTNDQVAASINGEKILVGEVRKILDERTYPVVLKEDQKKIIRDAAVEVLVEDILIRQYLTKQVPQVDPEEYKKVGSDLNKVLQDQKKTFEQFLKETGQSSEQLQRDIVAKLQWRALLKRMYPDDKLKGYYDANKVFFDQVLVRASHIMIKVPANMPKEERDKAMQQMLVWRQEILSGKAKFEDIAKQYSHCPSKDKGGDIGPIPYKFAVVPQFATAAFSLKVGDVSEVVQTVFGLHLIKVTDRSKGEPSNFETMKDTVREVWAQEDEVYQRILADQRKKGEVKVMLP
jgi:parvulin-like peptidyl-prolyl isomerase